VNTASVTEVRVLTNPPLAPAIRIKFWGR
jgi:hypothetical protein